MSYDVRVVKDHKIMPLKTVMLFQDVIREAQGDYVWDDIERFCIVHIDAGIRVVYLETFKGETVVTTIREIA